MRQRTAKLLLTLLVIATGLHGQDTDIDLLIKGELRMTFPSVYFKHNSTDYATMPYTVDSCFKYVALHFEDYMNSLVIWRDSNETEKLTNRRIKKLRVSLKKYIRSGKIEINSMRNEQKISQRTINMTSDSTKIKYLLSLNSVFDISKTRFPPEKKDKKKNRRRLVWTGWKTGFHWNTPGEPRSSTTSAPTERNLKEKNHVERPRLSCWDCWKSGFHLQTRRKLRKMAKHSKQSQQTKQIQ
ncbi:MAG TPA: hypothetical protein VNY73_09600 [Bacteroidia bacterium]|jgi:hypothetical protein|nr:hypothetical protein [Bacteroidia bacterium]